MSNGMLSGYPATKVIVDCECGVHAQYDKLEMLEVGGDRPLTHLLTEIVRRKGCTLKERSRPTTSVARSIPICRLKSLRRSRTPKHRPAKARDG